MSISSKLEPFAESLQDFIKEVQEWLIFLYHYSRKKILIGAHHFETVKDFLVDILLTKRGRYSRHFLNISFLFIVAGAFIGGPAIAQYYPTITPSETPPDYSTSTELSSISLGDLTTTTVVSDKPRFEIIDYEVVKGDTLSTIADKFGISVDTINWANSLKTEKLIPNQTLRIPPVTGMVHKVTPGDTIYSLAKKYKSDPQKIVNFPANDFSDLDTFALNVGQTLFIPDGVKPEAAPVYQPSNVPQFIAGEGGRFMWPTQGVITQYPVSYHMAVDIANNAAPPVAAGESGTISYAGCLKYGYGCHVIINHSEGYQTLYAHLSSYSVEAGDSVSRGQVIGRMGSTGRSTGTHLHFEVRRNGVILNPLPFLK